MDWIERANECVRSWWPSGDYRGGKRHARNVLLDGIEEVRALREERDDLKVNLDISRARRQGWEDRAKNYEDDLKQLMQERDGLKEKVERLERENAEYWSFVEHERQKVNDLNMKNADLQSQINSASPETLRDEIAFAYMNERGLMNSPNMKRWAKEAYKFADIMLEARKK